MRVVGAEGEGWGGGCVYGREGGGGVGAVFFFMFIG